MKHRLSRYLTIISLLVLIIPTFSFAFTDPKISLAQEQTRAFPETGKTITGKFLTYWNEHGALAQQGYPISEEMQEKSDSDGKTYTVQYFERAVFEAHPENQPPNDILLSLLGVFLYKQKYPTSTVGAPGQMVNNEAGSLLFQETGKRVGGKFLVYWQKNGGLAQQGLPISEEFQEKSDLNGQTYKVQYFERAVFEYHPENQPANDVLLSQLGTFQYKRKYLQPASTSTPAPNQAVPTNTPAPSSTSTPTSVPINSCAGVPPTNRAEIFISETCVPLFGKTTFYGVGFEADSLVGVYATMPNGNVLGAPFDVPVNSRGEARSVDLTIDDQTPYFGVWTITVEGKTTHRKVYAYFKLIPRGTPIP